MDYVSSRGLNEKVSASKAILNGLAPDGGLYVPAIVPYIDISILYNKSYTEIACEVLTKFLTDYDTEYVKYAVNSAYGERFGNRLGEVKQITTNLFSLELWHGPTCAFKDYALQLMPLLFTKAREMQKENTKSLILVATSGDTGKAALEGYKNIYGVEIVVFYPHNGTSEIQRLQMATQEGGNVAVYAVKGNFDDTQTAVKNVFHDKTIANKLTENNQKLSSANSINWGRLVPQIVYYFSTYVNLCNSGEIKRGDSVDFCVPTGNFGDILAGYYAKKMGLPINRLICASNSNNVLADFFQTGTYNANRGFYKTSSPSMDILISSNLERLLFHVTNDGKKTQEWMNTLKVNGCFTVDPRTMAAIRKDFASDWASEKEIDETISSVYTKHNYLCDPHTAAAFCVQKKVANTTSTTIIVSTADPYKFSDKVLNALGKKVPSNEFDALNKLYDYTGVAIPKQIVSLNSLPERFNNIITIEEIQKIALNS